MSLLIWLPLNGNLENIGGIEVTITNSNATFGTGKIGAKALDLINSSIVNISCNKIKNLSTFSISFWIKGTKDTEDSDWASLITFSSNKSGGTENYDFRFGKDNRASSAGYPIGVFNTSNKPISNTNIALTTSTDWDEWIHICYVYDGTNIKGYKNGVLVNSNTAGLHGYLTGNIRLRASRYNGFLSDFQVYSHCLSAAEVHKLAQGLTLHYKLDCGENCIFSTSESYTIELTSEATNKYSATWPLFSYVKELNLLKENTEYCVIYDYQVNTLTSTSAYIYSQINTSRCQPALSNTEIRSNINGTRKENFQLTADQATKTFQIRFRFYGNAGDSVTISNIKVLLGRYEQYINIPDNSGYNHNGTITGTILYSSNSTRYYNSAYIFDGSSSYITTPTLNFDPKCVTLNIWFKSTNITPVGDYHMIVNSTGARQAYEMCVHKTGYFRAGMLVNGTRYAANCTSKKCLDGNWHMLTLKYDGTKIQRYVDAVVESTTEVAYSTGLNPSRALRLGHDGTTQPYIITEGNISDFRVYNTALSDEDIKQLYELGAKIDNQHNLHTYEVVENATNIKFTNARQLKLGEIQENTITKFYNIDKIVEVNNLIEF